MPKGVVLIGKDWIYRAGFGVASAVSFPLMLVLNGDFHLIGLY